MRSEMKIKALFFLQKNMQDKIIHVEIWFTGRVQGVGFRYQSLKIAKSYDVCGEVKNLPDGRVWLAAEGKETEVEAFISEIQETMRNFIKESENRRTEITNTQSYKDFIISR